MDRKPSQVWSSFFWTPRIHSTGPGDVGGGVYTQRSSEPKVQPKTYNWFFVLSCWGRERETERKRERETFKEASERPLLSADSNPVVTSSRPYQQKMDNWTLNVGGIWKRKDKNLKIRKWKWVTNTLLSLVNWQSTLALFYKRRRRDRKDRIVSLKMKLMMQLLQP